MFRFSLSGKILFFVLLADCIITALSIYLGLAVERNPFVEVLLRRGIWFFVIVKIGISIGLVSALEAIKYKWPNRAWLVTISQWIAIFGYAFLYICANLVF